MDGSAVSVKTLRDFLFKQILFVSPCEREREWKGKEKKCPQPLNEIREGRGQDREYRNKKKERERKTKYNSPLSDTSISPLSSPALIVRG